MTGKILHTITIDENGCVFIDNAASTECTLNLHAKLGNRLLDISANYKSGQNPCVKSVNTLYMGPDVTGNTGIERDFRPSR